MFLRHAEVTLSGTFITIPRLSRWQPQQNISNNNTKPEASPSPEILIGCQQPICSPMPSHAPSFNAHMPSPTDRLSLLYLTHTLRLTHCAGTGPDRRAPQHHLSHLSHLIPYIRVTTPHHLSNSSSGSRHSALPSQITWSICHPSHSAYSATLLPYPVRWVRG